jgi:hypothetical protein
MKLLDICLRIYFHNPITRTYLQIADYAEKPAGSA